MSIFVHTLAIPPDCSIQNQKPIKYLGNKRLNRYLVPQMPLSNSSDDDESVASSPASPDITAYTTIYSQDSMDEDAPSDAFDAFPRPFPPPARPPRPDAPRIDWQSLEYVNPVDENLLCAICKTPFAFPASANGCRHTFCTKCLRSHLRIQRELDQDAPSCPLCRTELIDQGWNEFYSRGDRIVEAMVDELVVKCPEELCSWTGPRRSLTTHFTTCEYVLIPCVDIVCQKLIMRRSQEQECLHYGEPCHLCESDIEVADRYKHLTKICSKTMVECDMCAESVERGDLPAHTEICLRRTPVACKYKSLGCRYQNIRESVDEHMQHCVYAMIRSVRDEVNKNLQELENKMETIQSEHAALREAVKGQENTCIVGDLSLSQDHRERAQFMLETFDQIDKKISDLGQVVVTRDQQNAAMLHHEVMPIKDQLSEIRSQMGILSMHVRWLMDVQRTRQRQNIVNAFSGASNSGSESESTGTNNGQTTPTATSAQSLLGRITPPRPSL